MQVLIESVVGCLVDLYLFGYVVYDGAVQLGGQSF